MAADNVEARPSILLVDGEHAMPETCGLGRVSCCDPGESDGMTVVSDLMLGSQPLRAVIADLDLCDSIRTDLIQGLPKGLACIVVSANPGELAFRERVKQLEPVAVLEKPISLSELRWALLSCLGNGAETPEPAPVLLLGLEHGSKKAVREGMQQAGFGVREVTNEVAAKALVDRLDCRDGGRHDSTAGLMPGVQHVGKPREQGRGKGHRHKG